MDDPATPEQPEIPAIKRSIVPALLIVGSLISALAFFGKAAFASAETERLVLVILALTSLWSGFVLTVRHRAWVRSWRDQASRS